MQGNFIGTNSGATVAIPNRVGIDIENADGNKIIGNTIFRNSSDGVQLNSSNNTLQGNFIGSQGNGFSGIDNVGSGVTVTSGRFDSQRLGQSSLNDNGNGVTVNSGNNNIKSMNVLSTKFGVKLNEDLFNPVEGSKFEQGAVMMDANNPIFKTAKKVYIKELATLQVSPPAQTIVTKNGKNIIAIAKYGKGTVFVLGDPWLYNEYTDGRKLPPDFDNYKAAQDLAKWALLQTKKK